MSSPAPVRPEPSTTGAPGEFTEQLWWRFRPLVLERVDVLSRCVAAARFGGLTPGLREEAAAAAHNLTGTLDSYGRTGGSAVAAEAEDLLRGGGDPWPRLAGLVAELRAIVEAA
jgi:hypothetical protein